MARARGEHEDTWRGEDEGWREDESVGRSEGLVGGGTT